MPTTQSTIRASRRPSSPAPDPAPGSTGTAPPRVVGWSSSRRTLVASVGEQHALHAPSPQQLGDVLRSRAASSPAGLVLAGLPFAPPQPVALVTIDQVQPMGPAGTLPDAGPLIGSFVRTDPARAEDAFRHGVAALVDDIDAGRLSKAVLARVDRLTAQAPVDPRVLFDGLRAAYPGAYVSCLPLPGDSLLIGASPELLVGKQGATVTSHPLAGSAARRADPAADQQAARELQGSAKDLAEHRYVIEAIADVLTPYCSRLQVPPRPSLVATPTMWHLGTWCQGTLRDPDTSAAELAAALHPTPAICGTPTGPARDRILELEPFDREYYAGAVGWGDSRGDGEWAVAIRCVQVRQDELTLYAGAGIVGGSRPDLELAETAAKLRTVLNLLDGTRPSTPAVPRWS